MFFRKSLMVLAAVALVTLGTGCAEKAKAERDSLLKQNGDLNSQLAAEKAAREAADARAAAATAAASNAVPAGTPDMGPGTDTIPAEKPVSSNDGEVKRGTNVYGEATIQISGDVLFDLGKATLKPTAKKSLDKVAAIIKKEYGSSTLRVEGHTDPTPVKKAAWDDNWDLGAARARAVLLYLSEKGVPSKNMYIASFAANDLKSKTNNALNRRVEIVVVRSAK